MDCELCRGAGGAVLWQNDLCRVVAVDEPGLPGFIRVVLQRHVREMTDLSETQRNGLMAVVFAVEAHVRKSLEPDKMNLASLGNVTPHLHWHVIPRWRDDRHFPGPVWAAARNDSPVPPARAAAAARMAATLPAALAALGG
ncbi:MAG TPA: HIT family protein [Usitatibacteraceae bacterium]|nr:HIT family protein [Usitatibacteraceae bacterium]